MLGLAGVGLLTNGWAIRVHESGLAAGLVLRCPAETREIITILKANAVVLEQYLSLRWISKSAPAPEMNNLGPIMLEIPDRFKWISMQFN